MRSDAHSPATVLYVVRHAHAEWQPDEQHQLSAHGLAGAERGADLLGPYDIAAVYASPYPRAIQTVEPLAERLRIAIDVEPDLRERRLSPGRVADFEAAVAWAWAHPDQARPGGEPNQQALARIRAVIGRVAERHPGDAVVLATHGSIMAILFHALDLGFALEDWASMTMPDVFRLPMGGRRERLWVT